MFNKWKFWSKMVGQKADRVIRARGTFGKNGSTPTNRNKWLKFIRVVNCFDTRATTFVVPAEHWIHCNFNISSNEHH